MTSDEYEKRIAALGFETSAAWADFIEKDRATHYRQVKENRVPKMLQLLVECLELLPEKNPNTGRANCPDTMELLK